MDSNSEENKRDIPATSLLNQFILGQLKENQYSNGEIGSKNGFVLPKLQLGSTKATNFIIPSLKLSQAFAAPLSPMVITKTNSFNDDIGEISSGVDKMQVNESENLESKEEKPTPVIDLTAALSTVTGIVKRKRRFLTSGEDFEIPFIECDRQEKPILLPIITNYCQLSEDATTRYKNKRLAAPSSCGRIICLNYRRIHPLPKICHSFKVKHKIQRFRFDTKSPDDVVLATLNKYHRQY